MTLHAVPKPLRSERVLAKKAKQEAARLPKLRQQQRERIENYGRDREDEDGVTGPQFRRLILERDHQRCLIPGCKTPYLEPTAHHIQHVGAGGKNDPENGITLCLVHHDAEDTGNLARAYIVDALLEKHPEYEGYHDAE